MNVRQRRRKAQHELHAQKTIEARLLGIDVILLRERTRKNIHLIQCLINKKRKL